MSKLNRKNIVVISMKLLRLKAKRKEKPHPLKNNNFSTIIISPTRKEIVNIFEKLNDFKGLKVDLFFSLYFLGCIKVGFI